MLLHIDRKRLKEYVRLRTNKVLKSKDLFNIAAANKEKRHITTARACHLLRKIRDLEKMQNKKMFSEDKLMLQKIKKEEWSQDVRSS